MSDTLQLDTDSFYLLMDGDESVITKDQSTAIGQLQNGGTPDMDDIPQIIQVEFDGVEDWTLRELEWKQIAVELMQND